MKGLTKAAIIRRFVVFVTFFVAILGALIRTELKNRIGVDEFLTSDENECLKDLKCTPKWFKKYVQIHTAILSGALPLRLHIFVASMDGVGDRLRGMLDVFFSSVLNGEALLVDYPSPKDLETDIMQDLFLPRYLFWNRSIATSNLTLTGDATVDLLMDYDPPLMRARSTDVADISHIPDDLLKDVRDGGAYENFKWKVMTFNTSDYKPRRKRKNREFSIMRNATYAGTQNSQLLESDVSELKLFLDSFTKGAVVQESVSRQGYGGWFLQSCAFVALTDPTRPRIIKEIIGEMVQDEWLFVGRWTKVLHYLIQIAPRLRTAFAQSLKSLLEQIAEKTSNTEITEFLKNPPSLEKLSVQTPNSFRNYLKSRMSLSIGQLVGLHLRSGDANAFSYRVDHDFRFSLSYLSLKYFFFCAEYLSWTLGYKDPIFIFFSDHTGLRESLRQNSKMYTATPVVVPILESGSTFHLQLSGDDKGGLKTFETWSEFLILASCDAMMKFDSAFSIGSHIFSELESRNHLTYFQTYGCMRPKASKHYL